MIRAFSPSLRKPSQRGNGIVELALIMPILVLVFLGIAQYGPAIYNSAALDGAMRSAMAYALKNPTDTAGITTVAQGAAGGHMTKATVTPTQFCECANGTSVSCVSGTCVSGTVRKYMQIVMSVEYIPPLGTLAVSSMTPVNPTSTLTKTAIMRMQ